MWVIAGVLLGAVVVAAIAGFHVGPHTHAAASLIGVVAAVWLVIMAATGQSAPLLWTLFSADTVVSAGLGVVAWKALTTPTPTSSLRGLDRIRGTEGVASSDLAPDGIVWVRGESWSATSLNGPVLKGAKVQVVDVEGVRLQVWGDDSLTSGALDHELPGHPESLPSS